MNIIKIINFVVLILISISSVSSIINLDDFPLFIFSILSIIFYLVIFLFINTKYLRTKPLAIYINILSMIWIGIRVTYLNFRYESINYLEPTKYLANFNKYDVCNSLLLCILFTVFINLGLIVGDRIKLKIPTINLPNIFKRKFNFDFLINLFLLVTTLTGLSYFSGIDLKGSIGLIVPSELLIFILLSTSLKKLYQNEKISFKNKLLTIILTIFYLLIRTFIQTSKGAIFSFLMVILIIFLVNSKNLNIQIKYILGAGLMLLISIPIYFISFGLRIISAGYNIMDLNMSYQEYIASTFSFDRIREILDFFIGTSIWDLVDDLSRRVSFFDYLNIFFHGELVNDYMSFSYTLKVISNIIFPSFLGFSFPDAILLPSNLFKTAYGLQTYESNLINYHSDMVPIYGFLYANLWLVSLLVVFLIGISFAIIFRYLSKLNIEDFQIIQSLFLYNAGELIFGLGLAASFQYILFFTLIPLFFIYIFNNLYESFKS